MSPITRCVSACALACASLFAAVPAHADVYSFNWGYRWASGQIMHDTSVADSDPSASREVYANSVLGFDMGGLHIDDFTFPQLRGSGGTIVIDRAAPGSAGLDTITFLFGVAMPGDDAEYRLVATFFSESYEAPHTIDQPWSADLAGTVFRGGEEYFLAMTPGYETRHELVATAVPEPASWLLIGLGLAGLAAARHRKQV